MIHFILWYGLLSILGLAAFPIVASLLPNLPGKGYVFSRICGLLCWGYLYWIGGILGITDNSLAGLLFTLVILIGASVYALAHVRWETLARWLTDHRILVIVVEVLFLVAFAAWAYVRSLTPDIAGTEKPMELAFINAILRSESFPPHDPWLSGYGISYYYFGYVMVAMLAKVTATSGGVAFNLGVSSVFALSALGSFGVVYNLVELSKLKDRVSPVWSALLGPFFTLLVSNWEGFLHFLHSQGVFWTEVAPGRWVSSFWRWLDIRDLASPPTGQSFGHWWWWRASRVIQDVDFNGNGREVISEFPFFSYLLGDLHPHVLAMPFAFLVMGLALAVYIERGKHRFRWLGVLPLGLPLRSFLIIALAAGGMSFLNTWDFPLYIALLSGAYAFRGLVRRDEWRWFALAGDFLSFGLAAGLTGLALYIPFLISFDSQAGGLIPNILFLTPGSQLWVMFGPLFVPLFAFLVYQWRNSRQSANLRGGLIFSGSLWVILLLFCLLLVVLIPFLNPVLNLGPVVPQYLNMLAAPNLREAVREGLLRRVMVPGTSVTLIAMGTLAFGLLWKVKSKGVARHFSDGEGDPAIRFSLLLVIGGMVLVLVPEFVYLRDLFGYRLNTIFKFYYQAWLMWSVVAAFATISLFSQLELPWNSIVGMVITLSLAMSLVYPAIGLWSRTNAFNLITGKTLDGAAHFKRNSPDAAAAAAWLRDAPFGVVVESIGGSYSSHARMSTYSGLPTVLGWDFHEIQWRGDSTLVNPRKEDVRTLYCTSHWDEAERILQKYQVKYVVVGGLEYATYTANQDICPGGLNEDKFSAHMRTAFQRGGVTIYAR